MVHLPVDLSLFDTFCLFLTFDHRFCSKAFALCWSLISVLLGTVELNFIFCFVTVIITLILVVLVLHFMPFFSVFRTFLIFVALFLHFLAIKRPSLWKSYLSFNSLMLRRLVGGEDNEFRKRSLVLSKK